MIGRFILFLIINFSALAVGSFFTSKGVPSEWYGELNKAPWTPPGWVFGAAWTSIMVLFSGFMMYAVKNTTHLGVLISLFVAQWILNVSWNPVFFYYHHIAVGLLVITSLTLVVLVMMVHSWPYLAFKSFLLLPYVIWLLIATSLNAYILVKN